MRFLLPSRDIGDMEGDMEGASAIKRRVRQPYICLVCKSEFYKGLIAENFFCSKKCREWCNSNSQLVFGLECINNEPDAHDDVAHDDVAHDHALRIGDRADNERAASLSYSEFGA